MFECGEQLRKLAFKWKTDGMDSKDMKRIQKISNQFSKDILDSSRLLSVFNLTEFSKIYRESFYYGYYEQYWTIKTNPMPRIAPNRLY